MASCVSTGRELSFEWSHHRISSADSKVRLALQNSIKHSGSEGVKEAMLCHGDIALFGQFLCLSQYLMPFAIRKMFLQSRVMKKILNKFRQ